MILNLSIFYFLKIKELIINFAATGSLSSPLPAWVKLPFIPQSNCSVDPWNLGVAWFGFNWTRSPFSAVPQASSTLHSAGLVTSWTVQEDAFQGGGPLPPGTSPYLLSHLPTLSAKHQALLHVCTGLLDFTPSNPPTSFYQSWLTSQCLPRVGTSVEIWGEGNGVVTWTVLYFLLVPRSSTISAFPLISHPSLQSKNNSIHDTYRYLTMSIVSTWELSTHLMENQNMLSCVSYRLLLSPFWETKILPSLMLYRNNPRRSSDEWKILCLIIELLFLRRKKKEQQTNVHFTITHPSSHAKPYVQLWNIY